jgi:flagellar hook-associated protein 3 FlgL
VKRVSTDMSNNDMMYHLSLRQYRMDEMQNKIGSQTRVQNLRDDPMAASRSTRYQSVLTRMQQYSGNVDAAQGELRFAEGYLTEGVDILQRIRELAVQGANGTYNKEQLGMMAGEVNQLMDELVKVANSQDTAGRFVFSGFDSRTEPFRVASGWVPDAEGRVTTAVDYVGDIGRNLAQIGDNAFVPMNVPGNEAFWAEQQQVYASVDATSYRLDRDSTIRIDGSEIQLRQGDTAPAVIARINDSAAGVKASLDPVTGALVLKTTHPHQIWAEDTGGGTVLQDLGILARGDASPPLNFADSARVFGGSAFDMIKRLRDALYGGDQQSVGGEGLGGIDLAIESITSSLAAIGAHDARLQATSDRLSYEIPEVTAANSRDIDLDVTEAATTLKMLEYTHQAALSAAGRILPPTLLDFLR